MRRPRAGWAPWIAAAVFAAVTLAGAEGDAEEVAVPIQLQAELLVKVAEYDRRLGERAQGRVHVVVVTKPRNDDSARAATQLVGALGRIANIGGMPHDESVVSYTDAAAIAQLCGSRRVSIVYFAPGLAEEIGPLRTALAGVDVLSVASVPDYVPRGIVLGFDLSSGKPKLLVNLGQARAQSVAFRAEVLKLMRVFP